MKTKTNWTARTLARINSGELTEGEIRVIRARLAHAIDGRSYAKITSAQAWAILDAIEKRRPFVTNAQARKGADWLYKIAFTPKGAQRQTELAREFTPADLEVIKAVHIAPAFSLVTLEEIGRAYFPVYRAVSDAGAFEYCAAAWQSNARSFVTKHCPVATSFPGVTVVTQ